MRIDELLNSAVPYTELVTTNDEYTVEFGAGNRKIRVSFTRSGRPSLELWEMVFTEINPDHTAGTTSLTKSGNEFMVFSNVAKIAQEFLGIYPVTTLTFSAKKSDGARVSLYRKLIGRLNTDFSVRTIDHATDVEFVLTRE